MRKETQSLLEVIGTDQEYGTHGAISMHEALAYSIRDGRDITGYRFGGCKLDAEVYRKAVSEVVPILNQMSFEAFRRFTSFLYQLHFMDHKLCTEIKKSHTLGAYFPDQIKKRAYFLSITGSIKPSIFSLEELDKEKEVKKQYPWHWINSLNNYPEKEKSETVSQLIQEENLEYHPDEFIGRIHSLVRRYSPEYLDDIMSQIKGKIPGKRYCKFEEAIKLARKSKRIRENKSH